AQVPGDLSERRGPQRRRRPQAAHARLPDDRLLRARRQAAVRPPGRLSEREGPRRRHPALYQGLVPEIRVDPLTGLRTVVAGERASRPGAGLTAAPADAVDRDSDPFAEGHEERTPPEVFAVRPHGGAPDSPGWTVRVLPNLYPALAP